MHNVIICIMEMETVDHIGQAYSLDNVVFHLEELIYLGVIINFMRSFFIYHLRN